MFDGECRTCGSGLRERDRKCRLCGQDNPRAGGQVGALTPGSRSAAASPFGDTSPLETELERRADSFAAAALAPPTLAEQRKAAQRPRTRKSG